MDSPIGLIVILLCCPILLFHGVHCTRNPPNEDIERKSKNKYGDAYNCVDIYKQPAFDHPLLRNHTVDDKILSRPFYYELSEIRNFDGGKSLNIEQNGKICPVGTIPIPIITNDDLIRRRKFLDARKEEFTNQSSTFLAIARTTTGAGKYAGARGNLSIHNPKTSGQQFSGVRIKLQAGFESIEAGWRVDPSLNGDSQTHFYVRTDAGKVHCYNILCPGFIHTHPKRPVDNVLKHIRIPGGDLFDIPISIIRDNNTGNWNLLVTRKEELLGYWPRNIFTDLKGMANYVEWGGVVYSPPGTHPPPMGFGKHPVGSIEHDAYVNNIQVRNEDGKYVDISDIEIYDNSRLYSGMYVIGEIRQIYGYTILYGGPGLIKLV